MALLPWHQSDPLGDQRMRPRRRLAPTVPGLSDEPAVQSGGHRPVALAREGRSGRRQRRGHTRLPAPASSWAWQHLPCCSRHRGCPQLPATTAARAWGTLMPLGWVIERHAVRRVYVGARQAYRQADARRQTEDCLLARVPALKKFVLCLMTPTRQTSPPVTPCYRRTGGALGAPVRREIVASPQASPFSISLNNAIAIGTAVTSICHGLAP
jgi:hypothetical protein